MKKSNYTLISLVLLVGMYCAASVSYALDAPHNPANTAVPVVCNKCHYPAGQVPGWVTRTPPVGSTYLNELCIVCHSSNSGFVANAKSEDVLTHSSYVTLPTNTNIPVYLMECRNCHNPHTQDQMRANPSLGDIESGVTSAVFASSLTDSTKNWVVNRFKDALLLPNGAYVSNAYVITGNTATTLNVIGPMNIKSPYAGAGTTYKIKYGKLVKTSVKLPAGGTMPVTFVSNTGANSFVNTPTVNGVCQVCHTLTKGFKRDGSMSWSGHAGQPGANCTESCHLHKNGFKGLLGLGAGCNACHGAPPTDSTLITVDKNQVGVTSQSNGAGAHAIHTALDPVNTCVNCHLGGMAPLLGATEAGNKITMGFSLATVTIPGTYDGESGRTTFDYEQKGTTVVTRNNNFTCTNLYCHSNVQTGTGGTASAATSTPSWYNTASGQCGTCHLGDGVQGNASLISTGSHTKHVTLATYNFSCGQCHNNAGTGNANHVDNNIQVSLLGTGAYSQVPNTPKNGYGNCSTSYCHSTGQSSTGGLPATYVTATWGTTLGCNGCHVNMNSSPVAPGSHISHVQSAPNYACSVCHNGYTASAVNPSTHVKNGSIDVAITGYGAGAYYTGGTTSGNHASGGGYGTCNASMCHGSKSPAWGAGYKNYDNCTVCHGVPTTGNDGSVISVNPEKTAPGGTGTDTNGDTASTDPQVGMHQAHLTAARNYSDPIACGECHTVPTPATLTTHINDLLPAEVPLAGGLTTTNPRSLPQTPAYSGGQCNNTYCHDYNRFKNGFPDDATPPFATNAPIWNTTLLNGTSADCQQCHGYPPGGSHPQPATDCAGCHPDVAPNNISFSIVYQHINGSIEGGGCNGCHGQSNSTGAPYTYNDRVTTNGGTGHITAGVVGAHQKHVATLLYTDCNLCHAGNTMPTVDSKMTMSFSGIARFGGAPGLYMGKTLAGSPAYVYDPGTISTAGPMSCSNIYCHSDGGNYAGTKVYSSVTWTGAALTCDKCHGNGAGTLVTTNVHPKHVTSYSLGCQECHYNTTTDGATITTPANHVNTVKNVDWKVGGLNAGGSAYARPNCSTIYCHSQGISTTAPYGGAANTTAAWNGTALTCEGCHSYDAAATNKMATGKHTQHINQSAVLGTNYGCQECHNTTTTNGTTITTIANHVNGTRNVSMVRGGTWTSPNCTATYCHSTGQATPTSVNPGTWTAGAALTCDSCHGTEGGTAFGEPAYTNGVQPAVAENNDNSHAAHVTAAADCVNCHTDTVSATGTAIKAASILHTNQARNVNFAASLDTNGGTNSDNYNAGAKTCSSIVCHGAGTPMWGGATLACDQCHLANNTLAGKHARHYGVATVAVTADKTPSNTSSATVYEYSCGVCHNATPHATGNASANQAANVVFDSTIAGGGTYTAGGALAGTDTGGMEWTNGTCGTTYCHSQGASTTSPFGGAPNSTATWNGGAMNCESCHNFNAAATNKMATGKHTAHINDGTIMPNVACSACHTSTTSDSTTITTESNHVNKLRDVTIAATYDSDATPGNNWATSTCSNVYCHSTGEATPTYKPVLWTATITNCEACHNYDAAATNKMATGKHSQHINQSAVLGTNYGCQECHNTTTTNGTTITTPASHVDKVRDVSMLRGGTWTSPNCTATYCHSTGQATPTSVNPGTWTAGAALTCDSCHGTEGGTAFGEPAYTNGVQPAVAENNDNSHAAHVTAAADCVNCHTDTVSATGTAIKAASILHTNQARNVNFAASLDTNGGTNSDNYNAGAKTCSSIVCHGAGTPMWGGATLACDQCHLANNTLAGKHARHYGVATVAVTADKTPSNTSSATVYEYSCGVCHNATPHATGNASANQAANVVFDSTIAGGGTYTAGGALAGTDTGGMEWTNGTCGTTYCHSQGASTTSPFGGAPNSTATWNGGAMNCESCHNFNAAATNKMATGKHTQHINQSAVLGTNYGCQECHNTTTTDGTTITNEANHVNKTRDVSMLRGGTWTSPNCTATYCHSTGQATPTSVNPGTWTAGAAMTCDSCHGTEGGTAFGEPAYTNGVQPAVAENNDNSHAAHVTAAIDCVNCHTDTVSATGTAIKAASILHTNQARNVNFAATLDNNGGTNSDNYNAGAKTCSSIVCHGAGTPMWGGASLKCSDCHSGASDVVDYTSNGTIATINNTQWGYSGHGKPSSTYDITGNTAANFPGAVTTGDPCQYCHDSTVAHNDANNPLRLRNFADGTYGKNGVCMKCHGTGQTGVNPGTGYSLKTATKKVDKYHYAAKHGGSYTGGQYCWDCHDGHGDSTTTAGPIAMIQLNPASASNSTTAIPTTIVSTAVTMTGRTLPSNYGKTVTPFNGICNVCHTAGANGLSSHYTSTTSDGHNSTTLCTDCHKHSVNTTYENKAWEGAGGDCLGCHNSAQSDGANTDIDNNGVRVVASEFTKQSHHVTGKTLSKFDCAVCHGEGDYLTGSTTALHKNGQIDLRNADNASAYYTWTGSEHTNMDNFCMSCHDANGASVTYSRDPLATSPSRTNPFGDTRQNSYDQVVRTVVVDVFTAFNPGTGGSGTGYNGNYSQHAVRGARYSNDADAGSMYTNGRFDAAYTPLGGSVSVRDSSTLHCGDCHTNGQYSTATAPVIGAHGSNNEYLLRTINSSDAEHTKTTYGCFKCHLLARYSATHSNGNASDFVDSSTLTGIAGRAASNANITGISCTNCHNSGDAKFGGVHGGNATYTDNQGYTAKTYRFMPGLGNNKYSPTQSGSSAEADWEQPTAYGCYTTPTANWGSCTKHSGGAKTVTRGQSRKLRY